MCDKREKKGTKADDDDDVFLPMLLACDEVC